MDIQPAETAPLNPASEDTTPSSNDNVLRSSPSPAKNYFPDPDIHNPTAMETSQWWAEFTSIHGVYYMLERGHFKPWKTYAWTFFVLAMTSMLLWALIDEVEDFAKYSVDTTTKTIIPISMSFPRVTICNANGGRDSSLQNATGIIEPRNEEELLAISQPLDEFILHTEFNAREVESADAWTPVITPLGLCFSFVTNEKVFMSGISAGLLVHTWLNQSSYPETTVWAGVKIFVDPNGSDQDTSGAVFVPPGAVSFVAVTLQDFQREEDEPWRNCDPTGLSIEQCQSQCIMDATKENCSCRVIGDTSSPQYDYCSSSDQKCIYSLDDEDLMSCAMCSIPPCKEQRFSMSYSAGRISEKSIEKLRLTKYNSRDEISTNFVAIHINYDAIRYEETTETKSTGVWQLFSNLGGSFGFFMGISLVSIVELFVELIGLRLIPRLWGDKSLYGIGQKKYD